MSGNLRLERSRLSQALPPHNGGRRVDEVATEHVIKNVCHVIAAIRKSRGSATNGEEIADDTRCLGVVEIRNAVRRIVGAYVAFGENLTKRLEGAHV